MNTIIKIKKHLEDKDERNLAKNILGAFIVKGISLFISLFSMSLYIKYFDNDIVLGFWYTVLSLLSWISVCDLGLGNGLRNKLTVAIAKNDVAIGKRYITSTYISVTIIIFPIVIALNLLIRIANLNSFFNVPEDIISAEAMILSISILLIGVGINFILKIINNIVYAIQKAAINNLITLISSIIPLLYIFSSNGGNEEQNLIRLSLVHALAINLPLIVVTIILFCCKALKAYKPAFKLFQAKTAIEIMNLGGQFFFAQIFFLILMSTNETLISRLYTSEFVVGYTIYNRISTLIGSIFMLTLTPLWSKITKDLAEKRYYKIKRTNKVLYALSFFAMLCQFLVVPILQWIINIWLRDEAISVDYGVALVFALYGSLYIFNIALTTVANGLGELRTQLFFYGVGAVLKIPTAVLLRSWNAPWHFIVVFNCVILLLFCLFQYVWIEKRIKKLIILEE